MHQALRKSGLILLLAVVFAPCRLSAQAVGQIVGTVKDPTGAMVPNSRITAVQEGTAMTRATNTGASGNYSLPNLPVGTYDVTAEAAGFKKASLARVTLDVSQRREVDFTLALAGTTQNVEVTSAPPLLNTTDATVGGLVNGQQVSTLPLNGRDITNLVLMQPGVNFEVNSSFPFEGFVANNGNRGTTGSSYLDNSDTSDNELGGAQFTNFNLDAIAEFKVLQNNYSAEYGRGSGEIVQIVTKSGTNQLHGSLFEFVRNSAFDARNFFSDQVPPFRRNEFGGTVGGPVTIPHVYNGKDRTFFFFEYAGYRQRLGEPVLFPVPTALERQGIVPITGSNGQPDQLTVPLDPVAKEVMSRYPLPNDPTGSFGSNTYNSDASLPINRNQWSTRIDQHFSSRDSIYGRFTWSNNIQAATDPVALTEAPNFSTNIRYNQRNLGVTETHIFSPTLLNTASIGYTMNEEFYGPGTAAIPAFSFSDGSLGSWGPDTGLFYLHPATIYFNDKLNLVKNSHTMSMGFNFSRSRDNEYGASVGGPQGYFSFQPGTLLPAAIPSASGNNNLAANTPSPSSLISFMIGAPAFYQRTLAFPGFGPTGGGFAPFGVRRFTLAGWFQDDVKVTSKLTLNLGVRYEYNSVPHEVYNRMAGIVDDPSIAGGSVYRKLVLNPQPLYRADYTGIAPRFGLAYRITPTTVFRGGYGIFTNLPLLQTADQNSFGFPFASTGVTNNPPMSLTPLSVAGLPTLVDLQGSPLPPGGSTRNLKPNTPVDLQPVAAFFGGPLLTNLLSTNLHNGYTMAGNVMLEQQLPGEIAFQVGYVTNNAVGLYSSEWPNAYGGALPQFSPYSLADPGLGEFQLTDNHGHSTYNALQVVTRKTSPTHGITFQVSYTWSKSIDNASTVFNGPAAISGVLQNNPFCWRCEKAVSGFDFPSRLVTNFIYALPFGNWRALSSAPQRVTHGWQIASIIQVQSGFPFTVTAPFGTQEYGTDQYAGFQPTRPDLVQQPTLNTGGAPEQQFFSSAVVNDGTNLGQQYFATPGALTTGVQDHPGNLGRNTFRTGSFSNFDFSLIKDTTLVEGKTLQFRAEFFNLLNQHAFGPPEAILGSPGFGIATGTVLPERQIQFALRLIF